MMSESGDAPSREEAIAAAGRVFANGLRAAAAMTVEEQARAAYTPTGPPIPELERRIREHRAALPRAEAREVEPVVTREEAIAHAGRVLAESRRIAAAMTVEEQARAAYTPTGPSIPELEGRIRARRARAAAETPAEVPIRVPKSVRRHDPLVVAIRESPLFNLTGTPRKRALLLAEGVVKECRRHDWPIEVLDPRRDGRHAGRRSAHLLIAGPDGVSLWFAQPRLRSETPAGGAAPWASPYQYSVTNRLVVRATSSVLYGQVKEWGDTKTRPLEDGLGRIFGWISRQIEAGHAQRERIRAAQVERREQEKARHARLLAEVDQQRRRDALVDQAARWRQAQEVRAYLTAVRERLASEPDPAKVAETEAWLAESIEIVDRLDPLRAPDWTGVLTP